MEIDRRAFLKLLGITTGATTAGIWSARSLLSIPDEIYQRAFDGDHIETWKNSICSFCPGGCGIRVRLIDDIPVRILGNSKYPLNQGAVCPLAESGIEYLFHPDRIKTPLKRVGKRGANNWEDISWEEAIDLVTARLQKLISNNSIDHFVVIGHEYNDLSTDFINLFMDAVGSPNYLKSSAADIFALPAFLSQGWDQAPAFDLAHADFILNFGADLLDEEISPVYFNKIYGSSKSKIVHISSYQSRTAVASSHWFPINAGFGGALALGIANVIIRDGTYNDEFIRKSAFGFEDWTDSKGNRIKGFKRLVLEDYSPAKVAAMTGMDAG
ncbi:MAG: molybdopterin-dependent oxidoreductase, partial [Candidatus Marinimicrobia bacterium]|nr:molybdopterin-dependent oxidoreductase [Candidatus Neomarinimicrobiota bacterium]